MDTTFTEKYVKQIDLKSWSEFKLKVDSFKLEWFYRGQANASWKLASSLERHPSLLNIIDVENVEIELIDEYRKAIRSFLDFKGTPKTTLEWLSLLQHHGTPTRLIDFTESPYIGYQQMNESQTVYEFCSTQQLVVCAMVLALALTY